MSKMMRLPYKNSYSVLFQVNQLEQTMKDQNQEMERRVQKLDANVRKQEVEVQERTKQVL